MTTEQQCLTGDGHENVQPVFLRHRDSNGMYWACSLLEEKLHVNDVGPYLTKITREMWAMSDLLDAAVAILDKYESMPDGILGKGLVNGDFINLREAVNEIQNRAEQAAEEWLIEQALKGGS